MKDQEKIDPGKKEYESSRWDAGIPTASRGRYKSMGFIKMVLMVGRPY